MLARPPLNRRLAGAGLAILVIATAALRILAGRNPDIVEYAYARSIYPRISSILTTATGWASFSIAEVVVVILALAGLVAVVRGTRRAWRTPARGRRSVVFPQPLGPSSAWRWPGSTSRSTS
jgi:hypothetical protein